MDPISLAIAGGMQGFGALMTMLGSGQQQNRYNDLINYAHGAGNNALDFINGNTFSPGYSSAVYNNAMNPLMNYGQGVMGQANWPEYMTNGMVGNRNFLDNYAQYILPNLAQQPNAENNSFFQNYFMPNTYTQDSRYNGGLDSAFGNFGANGWNDQSANLLSYSNGMMQGQNPYMQDGLDYGNWFFQNAGQTTPNRDATSLGANGIRQGGWSGQNQGMFDMSSGIASNPYTQQIMGGIGQGNRLIDSGMGSVGYGQGMSDFGRSLGQSGMGVANEAISGMNRFLQGDPEGYIGARGSGALDSLAGSPYIDKSYNNIQGLLQQGTNNYGMNPYNSYMANNAGPRAWDSIDQSNSQMNDAWGTAMGAANGGVDQLSPWFNELAQKMEGTFGGMQMPQISGGGGGASASAGAMSRDLGPVDPQVAAAITKALAEFDKNPVMPTTQALSLARNSAATANKGAAEAVARRAVNLGGQGPIGFGGQNQAFADFADQASQNESKAITDTLFQQQGLGLQRSGQASQLAQAMEQIKAQREQLHGQMNIADAGNQTQASIASANNSTQAAGQSLQAQIANAANWMQMQSLKAGNYNALLNSATTQRGQNMEQVLKGMDLLPALQNSMTSRQGLLMDSLNQTGNRATQQFLGALGLAPQMNELANTDINRWNSIINPLVAGQATGTSRANTLGNTANTGVGMMNAGAGFGGVGSSWGGVGSNLASTGGGMVNSGNNTASNNLNIGVGGMGTAGANSNNTLNSYISLLTNGMNNATAVQGLGAGMVNNVLGRQAEFGGLNNSATNGMLQYGLGSGQLGGQLLAGQGQNSNNAMSQYLNIGNQGLTANQNAAGMYGNMFGANNASWQNPMALVNSGVGALSGIGNGMLQYNTGAMSLYPSYINASTFNPYGSAGPANPYAGIGGFLQQNAGSIGKGFGNIFGLGGSGGGLAGDSGMGGGF